MKETTNNTKNTNKTRPTKVSVEEYLKTVGEKRKNEAEIIINLMKKISKLEPKMWGDSIIGFGEETYSYDSGRSGVVPRLSFSPRKAKLTLYFNAGFNEYTKELEKLGKYTKSVSCLYVNKLEDVDLDILNKMFKITWDTNNEKRKIETVQEYIDAIHEDSKPLFLELREYVKSIIPDASEVYSYGILGYKTDKRRAKVYIGGYKDHLAIYPVPKSEVLMEDLKPYIKGKGTLWFKIDEKLPKRIIKKVVLELVKNN